MSLGIRGKVLKISWPKSGLLKLLLIVLFVGVTVQAPFAVIAAPQAPPDAPTNAGEQSGSVPTSEPEEHGLSPKAIEIGMSLASRSPIL
jgi:hypothetical protein